MGTGAVKLSSWRGGLLAALLLGACTGTPVATTVTPPIKKPPNTSGAGPSPAGSASATSATATSDPAGGAEVTPPPPGATPTPSITTTGPTATPSSLATSVATPAPLFGLPPAQESIATRVGGKLLAIAQVGFAQNRGKLAVDGLGGLATQPVGVLSNQGSGLLSDNGSGLIANNGGGLISDLGAGLIANNGGGLIANNSGGYRLKQATDPAAVSLVALAGETVFSDRRWPDDRRTLLFVKNVQNTDDQFRRVHVRADGTVLQEVRFESLAKFTGGAIQKAEYRISDFYADGSLRAVQAYGYEPDEAFKTLRIAMVPGASRVRDPGTGVAVTFDKFEVDLPKQSGAFTYVYEHLKASEEGTLVNVAALPNGQVPLTYDDPLGFYDGDSTLKDSKGAVIFTKKQRRAGGKVQRTYDLQGGLVADLTRGEGNAWAGSLQENGAQVATLSLDARVDGSVLFKLVFPGAEDKPVELGFGLTGVATPTPAPTATPPPALVKALAGGVTGGFAEGPGLQARFNTVSDLARSIRKPNRFYVADTLNCRIRTLDLAAGEATVGTLVGNGTQGTQDGASPTLSGPVGLVVAPADAGGETIYFTDQGHHAIRAIDVAANGTATARTLAGGARGYAEGAGAAARFDEPSGLAWETGKLYIADVNNHRVRALDLADPAFGVTTLFGAESGFADGLAVVARAKAPYDLAIDAQRRLFVTDSGNKRIRRVDLAAAGQPVTTVAGTGVLLDSFRDGPAGASGLNPPLAIALDTAGRVYTSHFDVRVLTPAGVLQTLAGSIGKGANDGPTDAAGFELIFGLAIAEDGTVLVGENHRIRAIMPPPGGSFYP